MRVVMVYFFFLVAAGCGVRHDPCAQDELFCAKPEHWERLASKRSTESLMRLQIINWNYYRPPSEVFAELLGQRKNEAFRCANFDNESRTEIPIRIFLYANRLSSI